MGKDNVVFHSVIWPAILLGASGKPSGTPGPYGELALPTEVVSSEFLTMESRKFSSSRSHVIYVRDVLERYGADPLRYYLSVAGPGEQRHRLHLGPVRHAQQHRAGRRLGQPRQPLAVAGAQEPRRDPGARRADRRRHRGARGVAGRRSRPSARMLDRSQQKAAITEAMRVVGEANKYLSDQAPWKLKDDPARRDTRAARRAAARRRRQGAADAVPAGVAATPSTAMLGGDRPWAGQPELREVEDLDGGPGYPVLTGDYDTAAVWESRPIRVGQPIGAADAAVRQARPVGRRRGAPRAWSDGDA